MPLRQITEEPTSSISGELRYDTETLRKVTVLAQELKRRHEDTFSPREMEAIGAEVGLEPVFIREAMRQLSTPAVERAPSTFSPKALQAFMAAWWSAAWTLPFFLAIVLGRGDKGFSVVTFMLGWGLYIGLGVFGSTFAEMGQPEKASKPEKRKKKREVVQGDLSRQDLLEALVVLQRQLESQREHRAFLSIDVVNSTGMKAGQDDLSVEYSFGQYQAWVEGIVTSLGGEINSAAGDGMMAAFRSDTDAVRAARMIQESMPRFNAQRNRLATPFQIRCGLTSGEIAIDPSVPLSRINSALLDRAAVLQKHAAPGDIVLSGELAQTALLELGPIGPHRASEPGAPVFSWHAARNG